jgi:hypothetical protein
MGNQVRSQGPLGRGAEVLAGGLALLAVADLGSHFLLIGDPIGRVMSPAALPAFILVPTGIVVVLGEISFWRRWRHWRTLAGACLIIAAAMYIPGVLRRAIEVDLRPRVPKTQPPSRSLSNSPPEADRKRQSG